jgi:DNA polymerase III subunit epsilon
MAPRRPQPVMSLRLRILIVFAALAIGALAALGLGLIVAYRHFGGAEVLGALVQGGVLAGLVILGLVVGVWYLFDAHLAKPIDVLAGALRARAHADGMGDMDVVGARHLGDLGPAARAATRRLAQTRSDLAEAVARETTRLIAEKARLEALLSDVQEGVVLCSGDHGIVFYNGAAADLLGTGAGPGMGGGPGAGAGLDRPLLEYLRAGPIELAQARLRATGDVDAVSDLLCTSLNGAQVLAARMRLVAGNGGGEAGYVLTLRDVTADRSAHIRREALMAEVFDRLRRPAANLGTLVESLPEASLPPRQLYALQDEAQALSRTLSDLSRRNDQSRAEAAPATLTHALDVLEGLRARIEAEGLSLQTEAADLLLRCDGYEVIALLSGLAGEMGRDGLAQAFAVTVEEEGAGALIRLIWQGHALPMAQLTQWLAAPLEVGVADLSRHAVLASHATEIWPDTTDAGQCLCLPIAQARRVVKRPSPVARPVVYDFDLLSKARSEKVQDTALQDLTYVVFDTETTGLQPAQGDAIVQIAAMRIVNGRRVEAEVFDTLVNPRRPIPLSSTEVHGITDAMVQDAPPIEQVAARFHAFAKGAVLVAHNAPFDMEFLRRLDPGLGLRFDNPVLDTVLLSAVIYGQHEVHTLDALTHRLGITIPEEARHTAIGDTIATADAFVKLLPMLQGRGLTTFGEVLTEVRRHGRLLKDLN